MELNFEGMKRILTTPQETAKQAEVDKEKREQMVKRLKEEDFDDLMQFTESSVSFALIFNQFLLIFSPQHDHIQNKLNELFNSLSLDRPYIDNSVNAKNNQQKPIYERFFPELFFF